MKIVIIDYGSGNLRSVYNAVEFLGYTPLVTGDPANIKDADKIILPGVGSFNDAVEGLKKRGLVEPIKEAIANGRHYLGMCLGLQILFEKSEEGKAAGLSVFKGDVKRFKAIKGLKVPHMGWNTMEYKKKNLAITKDIKDRSYFYFVHSYYADPADRDIIAGTTDYGGISFTSMIAKGNVFGTQFHPERSQDNGLRMLDNFLRI